MFICTLLATRVIGNENLWTNVNFGIFEYYLPAAVQLPCREFKDTRAELWLPSWLSIVDKTAVPVVIY